MANEDLQKLSDGELESSLTEAIEGVTAAHRAYENANDNLGHDAARRMPEASAKDLQELNDELERAERRLEAVEAEKQRRRVPRPLLTALGLNRGRWFLIS